MYHVKRGFVAALCLGATVSLPANGWADDDKTEKTGKVLTEDVIGIPGDEKRIGVITIKEDNRVRLRNVEGKDSTTVTGDYISVIGDRVITGTNTEVTNARRNDDWNSDGLKAIPNLRFHRMNSDVRAHLKLPKDRGLIVSRVVPESPESRMGLQESDIILTLGDVAIASPADLLGTLKRFDDKPVPLVVLRKGENVTIQVQPSKQYGLAPVKTEKTVYAIGLQTAPVDPVLRKQLKDVNDLGLAIRHIEPDGPAGKVKIAVGDILLQVNNVQVRDEDTLAKFLQENEEKPVKLMVIHEGTPTVATVTPEQRKVIALNLVSEVEGAPTGRLLLSQPGGSSVYRGSPDSSLIMMRGAPIGRGDMSRDGAGKLTANSFNVTLNPQKTAEYRIGVKSPEPGQRAEADPVVKKIDAMSSQIDSLRKSIDELAKAIKEKKD